MNAFQSAWAWLTQAQQWQGPDGIPARLIQHLEYTGIALAVAALIALPLGLLIGHTGRGSLVIVTLANLGRALPTLGLVVLAFLISNGSPAAVLVALVVLAIPPILVDTYEGVRGVDRDVKDAARGMGMTAPQILLRAEIPIATPLILLGLRTAAIQVVATATIAALYRPGRPRPLHHRRPVPQRLRHGRRRRDSGRRARAGRSGHLRRHPPLRRTRWHPPAGRNLLILFSPELRKEFSYVADNQRRGRWPGGRPRPHARRVRQQQQVRPIRSPAAAQPAAPSSSARRTSRRTSFSVRSTRRPSRPRASR